MTARLSNPNDETKIVDVSIECPAANAGARIHADLAREDGTVLQDLTINGSALAAETLERLERFLFGNVELLVAELATDRRQQR